MLDILPLEKSEAVNIVEWNLNQNADFLEQWAGRGYKFPITQDQIIDRISASELSDFKIYKIILDNIVIGTIELGSIDEVIKTAVIRRFLLDPNLAGKGYGTRSLRKFVDIAFKDFGLSTIKLTVFDFNKRALRCYEKVGFNIVSKTTRPNGWVAIDMEINNIVK